MNILQICEGQLTAIFFILRNLKAWKKIYSPIRVVILLIQVKPSQNLVEQFEETIASLGQGFLQSPTYTVGAQQKAETRETDLSLFILKTKVVDKAWWSKNNILSQTHRGSATSMIRFFKNR